MKFLLVLSLTLLSVSSFAKSGRCELDISSVNKDGSLNYNVGRSYGSNDSIKNCMKEAGKLIENSPYSNVQITMEHSLLDKKVIIRVEDK